MSEIIEWIKELPYWQQYISNEIMSGNSISEKDLEDIYSLYKREKGLSNEDLLKEELNFSFSSTKTNSDVRVKWIGMSNVSGVNALREKEKLDVGNQLTLIYGENGSGKSGYTRIMNKAFISRGDKNILPNIYGNQDLSPSATFEFCFDKKEVEELLYPSQSKHTYFEKVAVFDTISALNDLTKESELSFSPSEFIFFDQLIHYTECIKDRLDTEINNKNEENVFKDYFDKDTYSREIVINLSGSTNYESIKEYANITDDEEKEYEKKLNEKGHLLALDIHKKTKEYNTIKDNIQKIKTRLMDLNSYFNHSQIEGIKEKLVERNKLKQISYIEGLEQFENEQIENLGSKEWKNFITAAKSYYDSIDEEVNQCIFCKQKIKDVEVISKYWNYLKSLAEDNLKSAQSNIDEQIRDLKKLDTVLFVKESKIDEWLLHNKSDLRDTLIVAEFKFAELISMISISLREFHWNKDIRVYKIDETIFEDVEVFLSEKIDDLNSEEISLELQEIQKFEDEYFDKLKLERYLPRIEIFIKNISWVKCAEENRISTKRITLFQNKLFKKYVTQNYIDRFNLECKKLNADFSAESIQRGRKGTTFNKLTVQGENPANILSEGEQRSIALANFFAETGLNASNSCIVLDDPVSSLDYKRKKLIAKRLVEEAKIKQVVVLTHDITFLLTLQILCDKEHVECNQSTIRKIEKNAGIVQNSVPWIGMTVKKRISYLKNQLQNIEKTFKLIDSENVDKISVYEENAKSWCALLRETWERVIEEILFNNSLQRYSPSIQTQSLKNAPFTKDLYGEIEQGMSNCSNWVHDRASELGENVPEPAELRCFLNDCELFIKSNRV